MACLLAACGCSGEPGGSTVAAGGEPGYFIDAQYLDRACVASGIAYPIVTEERTIVGINAAPADSTLVKLHREAFADALGIYPRRFFAEIGLRQIILCRGLSVEGTRCHAFSDVERGRMFFNLDGGLPDGFSKRMLHHEIFHFIDFAEDGRLDEDRAWSALNPSAFAYGSGGASMVDDPGAWTPDESLAGFVNRYATSGLAEDKAEVYAGLIFDGRWMARRASADPILARKVERVRVALRRFEPLASSVLARFP